MYCDEMTEYIKKYNSPFKLPGLELAGTHEQSKAINNIKKPIMVIAGSGMCNGGRIKYHLVSNISRPESTIMFVGYQAEGTLGQTNCRWRFGSANTRQYVSGAGEDCEDKRFFRACGQG